MVGSGSSRGLAGLTEEAAVDHELEGSARDHDAATQSKVRQLVARHELVGQGPRDAEQPGRLLDGDGQCRAVRPFACLEAGRVLSGQLAVVAVKPFGGCVVGAAQCPHT